MKEKSRVLTWIIVVLCASVLLLVATVFRSKDGIQVPEAKKTRLDSVISLDNIDFGVARTSAEREKGLGGRKSMATSSGMLFEFEKPGRYGIWMKGMSFPIDIIWLDKDFTVVDIAEGVSPGTFPLTFFPQDESVYVIELNAGEASRHNIEIGAKISIKAVDNSR